MADDRNKQMLKADKLVRQGKLDQAISAYNEVIAESPKDMNLKNKIGDLYVRAGQAEEAVQVFNEIADYYGHEGFYLKAIAMLKKTNKLDPAATECYLKLADLYAKQGLINDAKSQYQQVSEVFIKAGNQEKAADALERLVLLDPSNIKLQLRLAELYGKLGATARAVGSYEGVGLELARTGMHDEALRIFEKGLSSSPGHSGLLAGLCRSLTAVGRAPEAAQRGSSALAVNPEHVGLHAAMAEVYAKTGDRGREREVTTILSKIDVDNPKWQEGLTASSSAKKDEVARVSQPVIEVASEVPDFSEMSGDFTMEELEEVSGHWNAADLAPGSSDEASAEPSIAATEVSDHGEKSEFIAEHMTEAEVFIKYGLVEKAIDNLEAIVSRYPDEAESLRRLRDLYLENGNKSKAADRCVDLAMIYRALGDTARASELLGEARAHDPNVQAERSAPVPVVPQDDTEYSFGEVPVEMDSSPPASGIELDFGTPAAGDVQAQPEDRESGIELSFDAQDEAEAIEVSLEDDGDGHNAPIGIDFELPTSAMADEASTEPAEGDLSEVTFYIEQGFVDQARSRLDTLRLQYPTSVRLAEMRASLDSEVVAATDAAAAEEGIEFFDDAIQKPQAREEEPFALGSDSSEDSIFQQEVDFFSSPLDAPAEPAVAASSGEFEDDSIEAIFQEFKKGIEEKVGIEDYETHYNLGIAYKEMGLIDEAISEFQLASKDETKFVDACSNLGLCFREKGMPKLAVKWYEKAIIKLDTNSIQYVAILYDLAASFEESGDKEKALEMFTDVYGLDASFREVAEKLRSLGS